MLTNSKDFGVMSVDNEMSNFSRPNETHLSVLTRTVGILTAIGEIFYNNVNIIFVILGHDY